MSTYAKMRTARKTYRCDSGSDVTWFRACKQRIEPGDKYVRSVRFPDDVNSSDIPWVIRLCIVCADGYDDITLDGLHDMVADEAVRNALSQIAQ